MKRRTRSRSPNTLAKADRYDSSAASQSPDARQQSKCMILFGTLTPESSGFYRARFILSVSSLAPCERKSVPPKDVTF